MHKSISVSAFNTSRSIKRAAKKRTSRYVIKSKKHSYEWEGGADRIKIIRGGLSYDSIEFISKKLNSPIKAILTLVGMPQTTYNKNVKEDSLLDIRNSELIVLINELIDFGLEVFNNEAEKLQNWLRKPNLSLGGTTPLTMLDTITGINEVKFALNRLEFGNLA